MSREQDAIDTIRRDAADRFDDDALDDLRDAVGDAAPPISLTESLAADRLSLIVEPKRASVSGRAIGSAEDQAALTAVVASSELSGATAVSIVTESRLGRGSLLDLRTARAATELPILARDFVVHHGQVLELRAAGADALLIAMSAFDDDDDRHDAHGLADLIEQAHELGMDVVLSVRSEHELQCALEMDADAFNIDNRAPNGSIDVDLTIDLLTHVPVGNPVISESVARLEQVTDLHRAGVDALLLDEGHLDGGLAETLAVFRSFSLGE